ncbi:MAG: hypothetical protein Q9174_000500 [Haloplaca sp. 1 TL-2023]
MGANQSTGDGSKNGPFDLDSVKTCYYEVLGVSRQASEDEIKQAYRKKALELHPDRNYGNADEATKSFAEVQSAYEVLSDAQERAWYDSHRETFLEGDDVTRGDTYEHNIRLTTTEDIMKLLPKVNACRDFSDSPSGFHALLRRAFQDLAREEDLACEWEGIDSIAYPSFGHAKEEDDSTVRSFYAAWASFATRKTFSWKDIYRYSEAPDRRIRRLMEKENKRIREEAIREFNDAVRSLVAFVKKRDPRFKPSVRSEVDRQRVLKDAANAQAARSRAANQSRLQGKTTVPEWAQCNGPETSEESDAVDEAPREVYECVVCDKTFRSEKQFEVHEKSKKHNKAAQQVRREMQHDDRNLRLGEPVADNPTTSLSPAPSIPKSTRTFEQASDLKQIETLSVENASRSDKLQNETVKDKVPSSATQPDEEISPHCTSAATSDDEYADRKDVEDRLLNPHGGQETEAQGAVVLSNILDATDHEVATGSENDSAEPQRKIGKAKVKRAKKAGLKSTAGLSAHSGCAKCLASFPSKTKLFDHIKSLDHAQPITRATAKGRKNK